MPFEYDDARGALRVNFPEGGLSAAGNVRIVFRKPKSKCGCCCKKMKTVMLLVFHTSWSPLVLDPETGSAVPVALSFQKHEVDGAHKDCKENRKYGTDFQVRVQMTEEGNVSDGEGGGGARRRPLMRDTVHGSVDVECIDV